MSVHKKLIMARMALQGTKLSKSGHNKFAGYDYFELGDFLPAIQSIFADLDLIGIVSYTAELATLTITDTESNTSLTISSPMGSAALKGCHEVQNIGAVETYQRRYLWVTAMEIVEHDALDATTGKVDVKPQPAKATKSAEPKLTETQVADIIALADECQIDVEQILEAAKIETLSQLEATRYSGLITWIKAQRSAA